MTVDQDARQFPEGPRTLGRYTLGAQLGEGGMGVVYRASRPDGPDVAIKVLRAHIAHDPQARRRLEREVETLSQVHHPRVAAVLDADVDGDAPYIVTEFVPGSPLDVLVSEEGPLPPAGLVRLGEGLSSALVAIHQQGIVHRDLKPGNVLMVGHDPVVIDFGIAQVADDVRLTMTGMVMGTPGYLSPEVVEGGAVTEATDWWGWAASLAFAASGQPPFGTGPMAVVLDRVIRGRHNLSGVDPQLRPLLAAALDPDAGRRPHASEVVAALQLYANDRPVTQALSHQPRDLGVEPDQDATTAYPAARSRTAQDRSAQERAADDRSAQARAGHHRTPDDHNAYAPAYGAPYQEQAATRPAQTYPTRPAPTQRPDQRPDPVYYPRSASSSGDRYPAPRQGDWGPPQGGAAPGPAPSGDPRIGRPARSGTMAALLTAVVGICAVAPMVGWGLLGLWSVAARTTDQGMTSLVLRRHERGARRSDMPVIVALAPWHAFLATLATILALLLPVAFAVAATVVVASGLSEFGVMQVGYEHPLAIGLGSLLGAVIAWWGPGGMSLRRGSRTLVRAALPGAAGTVAIAFFTVLGLVLIGYGLVQGQSVSWWPGGPNAPFSDLIPQILRP